MTKMTEKKVFNFRKLRILGDKNKSKRKGDLLFVSAFIEGAI